MLVKSLNKMKEYQSKVSDNGMKNGLRNSFRIVGSVFLMMMSIFETDEYNLPNPVRCTHLWRATIPSNQPVGKHEVEVRATGRDGRSFVASSIYELK
jgi:hypothetical protein